MSVRLPTILGKAIDDTVKTLNEQSDEDVIKDLVHCIEKMEDLMDDLHKNSKLRPIEDDGEGDIPLWNKEIAKYFRGKDFMNAPWLFAEAYKYRSMSKHWKDYDVFFRQKCETFSRSGDAVFELSTRFADLFMYEDGASAEKKEAARKLIFHELTQGESEDDIKKLQSTGGDHLASTEANILGNDMSKLWDIVSKVKYGRIDFVLDNAGFELYCDLVYADWLIQAGVCKEVRFHGKRFAWFVSDVTKKDFEWLVNTMVYGHLFTGHTDNELASLKKMGQRWKKYVTEKNWIYEQHPFWITGYTFWDIKTEAPDLFLHLSHSDLVMFKGDLNHRKLTYDCHAPPTTPFEVAIGPLASEPGTPPVCSLRTIKSDVVVGIKGEDAQRLDKEEPGWKISGRYAVILVSEGHKDERVQLV
ncbi:MAG: hypothetical protein CYPHOPRED_004218 [Cyphobasidiales sp. Tagirdzhanova-0007]|nr:MAG: hypothetical protein CYPHOPRED_004218 [Cyphobasidiales sp. Tagirdzhanova-0007]